MSPHRPGSPAALLAIIRHRTGHPLRGALKAGNGGSMIDPLSKEAVRECD
jgi:hypothetical protein